MFFNAKSPFCKAIQKQHSPDDLLAATVSQDPLSHLICDETGPIFYENPNTKGKYLSAHILIGVELVTYRTHLVVINSMSAVDVIKGLEILQNLRGSLINIIMDHHSSHVALLRDSPTRSKLLPQENPLQRGEKTRQRC